MTLVNLNDATLPGVAGAVRDKLGDVNTYLPAELPEKVGLIRGRSVKSGVIKLTANSQTLTIPATGKLVNVLGFDVPKVVGYLCSATWSQGACGNDNVRRMQLGVQERFTTTSGTVTHSGLTTTVSEGQTTFDTANASRFFAAGATYVWTCFDWADEIVEAVYEIGDTGSDVQLVLLANTDGKTFTAWLCGSGATVNYEKDDERPWEAYVDRITAVYVAAGVTSLGDYLFARHEAVTHLQFEDSRKIAHLGLRTFHRCQFGGSFSFSGLTDETMRPAFASCTNLRGVTVPETVTAIEEKAFILCRNLREVKGLANVATVGEAAFHYTPRLANVDLDPAVCQNIDEAAFCISPALSRVNAAAWSGATFGYNASASANWTAEQLAAVRAVQLPNVLLLDFVPDAQYKYSAAAENGDKYAYGTFEYQGQTVQRYLDEGCEAGALCTVFNVLKGTAYDSIGEWWIREVYEKNAQVGLADISEVFDAVLPVVGLQRKATYPIYANAESLDGAEAFNLPAVKRAIVQELSAGNPLILSFWTTSDYGHAVAIIGADATTDQLIIADTARSSGDRGMVYKVALEDLVGVSAVAHIDAYEVG